jgi:hypothetical protein
MNYGLPFGFLTHLLVALILAQISCWIGSGTLALAQTANLRDVRFIGIASIDGKASDKTELSDVLSDNTPHNQFGGISGIDWIPGTDRFLALSDRGPKDGAVDYLCRFHEIELSVPAKNSRQLTATIIRSIVLKNSTGQPYVGASHALKETSERGHRFDAEGIRIDANGEIWIADEYGPYLFRFSNEGTWLGELTMPSNLTIAKPAASSGKEDQRNISGRRSNRGMEGLAITPSGRYMVGIMQSPLIQDGYRDDEGKIIGHHVRLIRFDLETGQSQQFVYRQEAEKNKIHEILAIDEDHFLVLEQDGKFGAKSKCKSIFEIDISQATEVSPEVTLSDKNLPAGIQPVSKKRAINLLDPKWKIADTMPEKVEGLSWGPNLPDGRRMLIVATDNDFRADQATLFYVFGIKLKSGLTATQVSGAK